MPLTRNELKKLTSLQTRKGRRAHGLFVAEGVRLLEVALRHGVLPETVCFDAAERSARPVQVVTDFRRAGVRCEEVSPHQLESLADTETPQGIVAVFRCFESTLPEVLRPEHALVLICDGVSDPGNLGTLIRSALAFGFERVLLTGASADPFSPKVVRATAGALFAIRIARCSLDELLRALDERRFRLIATSGRGDPDPRRLALVARAERLALAVGSEHEGLSPGIVARSGINWRVRHSGDVESLNAAVAGSIVMKEIFDARGAPVE